MSRLGTLGREGLRQAVWRPAATLIGVVVSAVVLFGVGASEARAFDDTVSRALDFASRGGWMVEITPRENAGPLPRGRCAALASASGVVGVLEVGRPRLVNLQRDPANSVSFYRVWPLAAPLVGPDRPVRFVGDPGLSPVALLGARLADELATGPGDAIGVTVGSAGRHTPGAGLDAGASASPTGRASSGLIGLDIVGGVRDEPRFERFSRSLLVVEPPVEVWSCLVAIGPVAYPTLAHGALLALMGVRGDEALERPMVPRGDGAVTPGEAWRIRSTRFAALVGGVVLAGLAWSGAVARRHDQAVYRVLALGASERLVIAQVEAALILVAAEVAAAGLLVVGGSLVGASRPAVILGIAQSALAALVAWVLAPLVALATGRAPVVDALKAG